MGLAPDGRVVRSIAAVDLGEGGRFLGEGEGDRFVGEGEGDRVVGEGVRLRLASGLLRS